MNPDHSAQYLKPQASSPKPSYVTKISIRSGRRDVQDPSVRDLLEEPEQPEDLLFDVSAEQDVIQQRDCQSM